MGAAAIGLVRVADGIAGLYCERHLNGWDMLAVIACAAGLQKGFDFLREQAANLVEPL